MKKIAAFIVQKYRGLIVFFVVLSLISIWLATHVKINYSLESYMPEDSSFMVSLHKMQQEFDKPIPNLRIAIKDTTIQQTIEIKNQLLALEEIKMVLWLDTFVNPYQPLDMIDEQLLQTYYQNNTALLQVAVETDNANQSLQRIKQLLFESTAYEGSLVTQAAAQNSVTSEITTITMFAVPVGLFILVFAVNSWIEPLLILFSIGVAIIINMGSNVIFGEISFVTQSVSSILQLAVSLDYAIFLLHEFARQKKQQPNFNLALQKAITISSSAVVSSALTTVFGFLVLIFMRYGIGKDLGLVLSKGIFFSLFSVIFFLPALVMACLPLLAKTSHRSFLSDFTGLSKKIVHYRKLFLIILLIAPIAFIGQFKNDFTYGMGDYQIGSKEAVDKIFIQDHFNKNIQIVALVPKGDLAREHQLIQEIKQLPLVTYVQSYSEQVGLAIPIEIAPKQAIKDVISEHYSRIIINTTSESEGDAAFQLLDSIRLIINRYTPTYELIGESVALQNMRELVVADNQLINFLAILSVALVIMINFKSLTIPLLLVLTIETSIWINLAIPYFTATKLSFIGYLIISSIQLGATVDYAILFTSEYLYLRQIHNKLTALTLAGSKVYGSIMTPAIILTSAGIILQMVSSIALVSELGQVLARGALLSLVMVMILLPALLALFDQVIAKTTLNAKFKHGGADE